MQLDILVPHPPQLLVGGVLLRSRAVNGGGGRLRVEHGRELQLLLELRLHLVFLLRVLEDNVLDLRLHLLQHQTPLRAGGETRGVG